MVNQARTPQDAEMGHAVVAAWRKYFGLEMDYLGAIDYDDDMWRAVRLRQAAAGGPPRGAGRACLRGRGLAPARHGRRRPRRGTDVKRLSDQTLYEILEVSVDAPPEEIERAYAGRSPSTARARWRPTRWSRPDEAALLNSRIEEARTVLLDPVARGGYDERIERARPDGRPAAASAPAGGAAASAAGRGHDPLAAPGGLPAAPHPLGPAGGPGRGRATAAATARAGVGGPAGGPGRARARDARDARSGRDGRGGAPALGPGRWGRAGRGAPARAAARGAGASPAVAAAPPPPAAPIATPPPASLPAVAGPILLKRELSPQRELLMPEGAAWTGEMLRQVREARGSPPPPSRSAPGGSRYHIENIEADRFPALPAAVYLRGIIMSLSRELRLDGQKVARSYLERMAAEVGPAPRK